MENKILRNLIFHLNDGYSTVIYNDRKYGLSKTVFNNGKSIKLFAEELGGKDFISLNYYITDQTELLKPCEMPKSKVLDFLYNLKPITDV